MWILLSIWPNPPARPEGIRNLLQIFIICTNSSTFIVTVTCVLLLFEFVGIKTGCKKQYSIKFTDWYIYNKHLNKIKSGLCHRLPAGQAGIQ